MVVENNQQLRLSLLCHVCVGGTESKESSGQESSYVHERDYLGVVGIALKKGIELFLLE